jgi:ABC-type glycerol-3-phosphate transport system substrate-binding protein
MAVSVRFVRRLLLGAISLLALSACGNDSVQSPAANPAATAPAASATQSAPDTLAFTAPRVGGGTIDLAQYAGTPVLLWFWAPT